MGKLKSETTSIFWVDVEKSCATERRFHCRIPVGWLTPVLFLFLFMLYMLLMYMTCYTCYLITLW